MARPAETVRPMGKCLYQMPQMDKAGVWEKARTALIEVEIVDETTLMLDSTLIDYNSVYDILSVRPLK
jgi:ATP:corrinoid adenosyltransferase